MEIVYAALQKDDGIQFIRLISEHRMQPIIEAPCDWRARFGICSVNLGSVLAGEEEVFVAAFYYSASAITKILSQLEKVESAQHG